MDRLGHIERRRQSVICDPVRLQRAAEAFDLSIALRWAAMSANHIKHVSSLRSEVGF